MVGEEIIAFLVSIFIITFVFNFLFTFMKGRVLYRPFIGFGDVIAIKGTASRILSLFCSALLLFCYYFWIPNNKIIFDNILYSNLASIFTGMILGTIIYARGLKFNPEKFNKKDAAFIKKRPLLYALGIIIFYLLLVMWKLYSDGYLSK